MRYYGTITGLNVGGGPPAALPDHRSGRKDGRHHELNVGGGPPAALPALEEAGGLGWVELISLALAAAGVLAAVYLYGRGKRGRS